MTGRPARPRATAKIGLQIEGPKERGSHLELSVFVKKIGQFLEFLKSVAKEEGADGVVFRVVNLSHTSPATVECVPEGTDASTATAILGKAGESLGSVEERKPGHLSVSVLSSMEDLARCQPSQVARVRVQTVAEGKSKRVYKLDDRFRANLSEARSAGDASYVHEREISTMDGKLERINIHGSKNTFRIYPNLPRARYVDCDFPENLLEVVQGALGRYVSVWGECFYKPDAPFPYRMEVREMEVLPPSEELPSLSDLRGIAPDATGSLSAAEFVRKSRDAWDKGVQ